MTLNPKPLYIYIYIYIYIAIKYGPCNQLLGLETLHLGGFLHVRLASLFTRAVRSAKAGNGHFKAGKAIRHQAEAITRPDNSRLGGEPEQNLCLAANSCTSASAAALRLIYADFPTSSFLSGWALAMEVAITGFRVWPVSVQ